MKKYYFILVQLFISSTYFYGQTKINIITDINNGWSITTSSQPYDANGPITSPDWITNLSTNLLNSNWDYSTQIADIASIQNQTVSTIGAGAKPIWKYNNICNSVDDPTEISTYYFRKTFNIDTCSNIQNARLIIAVDNLSRVYLNGHQLFETNPITFENNSANCTQVCGNISNDYVNTPNTFLLSTKYHDIIYYINIDKNYFNTGTNVLAIEGINIAGCFINYAWVVANLEIELTNTKYTIQPEIQDFNCFSGNKITLIPNDTLNSYTFTINNFWSNNNGIFNNLNPGNYSYLVTNQDGCKYEGTFNISNFDNTFDINIKESDLYIDCKDTNTFIQLGPVEDSMLFYLDDNLVNNLGYFQQLSVGNHFIYATKGNYCHSDSIYFEIINDKTSTYVNIDTSICQGSAFQFNGKTYYNQGIYTDTILNQYCEEIYVIYLKTNKKDTTYYSYNLCLGDTLKIGTINYYYPGNYFDTLVNKNNCDSIIYTRINNIENFITENNFTLCPGDSINIGNKFVHKQGVFIDTIASGFGCDSIIYSIVNLVQNPKIEKFITLCPGDSININNRFINKEGVFIDTLNSSNGCDSILKLIINFDNSNNCPDCNYYIPNSFSPNNDGINDEFKVESKNILINEMIIFNRWGGVLFSSKQLDPSWNGYYNGKIVTPDVYVYLIRGVCPINGHFIKYGDVTLIK